MLDQCLFYTEKCLNNKTVYNNLLIIESFSSSLQTRRRMMHPLTILKVILGDNSSRRLTFQNGLPGSVNELVS